MVNNQSLVWWRRAPFSGAVLATVALTVLAACGSSGSDTAAATPPPAATAAADGGATATATPMTGMSMSGTPMPGMQIPAGGTGSAAPAPVTGTTVDIKNFAFSPANLTVRVGTTVTWTNRDSDAHTVVSSNGPLRSPTLDTGDSYRYTFTKVGTYAYLCSIHPFMLGSVEVTA